MLNGIDVSRHQGYIDWEKVKPHIDFAMIRAGFGDNNLDAKALFNMAQCERFNIPFGVYWFSYALHPEMARKEAEYCLDIVGKRKLAFPVVYDFEYDTVNHAIKQGAKVDRAFVLNCTREFCKRVEERGFYAMFYTNNDYYKRYYQGSDIPQKYDMWYARYADQPGIGVNLWQKTDRGKIPGITGYVDLDVSYRDYQTIMDKNDLNNYD